MPSSGSRPGTLRSSSATARGTFSMAADTRGQFHEWSKEQYVVRNSRCPLKLLPNNAPTLTRELSALSTSQTSRNEKVPNVPIDPCPKVLLWYYEAPSDRERGFLFCSVLHHQASERRYPCPALRLRLPPV